MINYYFFLKKGSTLSIPSGILATNTKANGAATSLTFTIIPSVQIPNSGFIKVELPSEFAVAAVSSINSFNSFFFFLKNFYKFY